MRLRHQSSTSFLILALFLFSFASNAYSRNRLPPLAIDAKNITVSGVSSGGFMAVQLHIAHSEEISGAGIVAGGIYWCAEGNPYLTANPCMLAPWLVNVGVRTQKAVWEEQQGRIDPLSNLERARVYIYGSPVDPVVNVTSASKLHEFYSAFMDPRRIQHRHDVYSSHGFPTSNYGATCGLGGYPWILNCGVDVAGEILTQMYGDLRAPASESQDHSQDHLYEFDQTEFMGFFTGMASTGSVYIPTACRGRASGSSGSRDTADEAHACKLHIALHGCGTSPLQIGDAFTAHAGYNRWAEANNIVVLYPTVATTPTNPLACWDWYGYTGYHYVNKLGPQIQAIQAMIDRLSARPERRASSLH